MTPRFRFPMEYKETCLFLEGAYKSIVECRGMEYNPSSRNEILLVAKWLCESKKVGLILNGGVGNGKTTMSKALLHLLRFVNLAKVWDSFTINAVDLVKVCQERNNEFYEKLKKSSILIIDDLATESNTIKIFGNEKSPIIELLFYRYDKRLVTICTTNRTKVELGEMYGERIADRCNEMFAYITFKGQSYR